MTGRQFSLALGVLGGGIALRGDLTSLTLYIKAPSTTGAPASYGLRLAFDF